VDRDLNLATDQLVALLERQLPEGHNLSTADVRNVAAHAASALDVIGFPDPELPECLCHETVHGKVCPVHGEPYIAEIFSEAPIYRDGQPCPHPGCLSHVSHPCEGCGRIGGRYPKEGGNGRPGPPWWAGKDVVGYLRRDGWQVAEDGLWLPRSRPSALIPAEEIIHADPTLSQERVARKLAAEAIAVGCDPVDPPTCPECSGLLDEDSYCPQCKTTYRV
jgi:hypothetical protein